MKRFSQTQQDEQARKEREKQEQESMMTFIEEASKKLREFHPPLQQS